MDGFSIWLSLVLLSIWVSAKPALPPHPPTKSTIILLPDAEGKKTGIVIDSGTQKIEITEPYQGVELSGTRIQSRAFSAADTQKLFPDVIQAIPEKPRSFTLHFEVGGAQLTPESVAMIGEIRQEIARRAAPEVVVIGHTDRTGSEESNFRLSLIRAEAIRDLLVANGVSAEIIRVVGRGELEPEVVTENGVAEPRNRRVEISVR